MLPSVEYFSSNKSLVIKGRCYPENVLESFTHVFEFIRNNTVDILQFKLDYFNTSMSKIILDLILSVGKTKTIEWYYKDEDDLDESGMFELTLGFKFKYIKVDKDEKFSISQKEIDEIDKKNFNNFLNLFKNKS